MSPIKVDFFRRNFSVDILGIWLFSAITSIGSRMADVSLVLSPAFTSKIHEIAKSSGADGVGITSAEPFYDIKEILEERKGRGLAGSMQFTYRNPERSTDVSKSLEGAKSIIVCYVSYAHAEERVPGFSHSKVAQYAASQARTRLDSALQTVAKTIVESDYKARVLTDDNGLVDRAAAMRAGLGFYGKNSLLITKDWGSTVLLGSVITTAPLYIDAHKELNDSIDGCGKCVACIPACPTGAIVEPGVIDASKCLSWIAQAPDEISHEHRIAMGNKIYGCDDCQDACPHNKIQQRRTSNETDSSPYLEIKELLSCSDEELMNIAEQWYVYKRDPRYIRRNALINAGNSLPMQSVIWDHVQYWSRSDDEMLSSYALWALGRRKEKLDTIR